MHFCISGERIESLESLRKIRSQSGFGGASDLGAWAISASSGLSRIQCHFLTVFVDDTDGTRNRR